MLPIATRITPDGGLSDRQIGNTTHRYDCNEVKCTELDEYVWRDNNDWSYSQLTTYGSLVGPVPVKIFVRDSRTIRTVP